MLGSMESEPRSRSPWRWLAIAVGVAIAAAVGSQLIVPRYAEHQVKKRLEAGGGRAEVSLAAFPALRLLASDGSSIRIRGHDLDLPLPERSEFLERLDGFGRVDVRLRQVHSEPFRTKSFVLSRVGSEPYRLVIRSSASASELGGFAGARLAGPLGAVAGALAGGALPRSGDPVPIDIDARFENDGGKVRIVSGGGSVAGIPVDPLIELFGSAIASTL